MLYGKGRIKMTLTEFEAACDRRDAYQVMLLRRDGGARVYQSYPGSKRT